MRTCSYPFVGAPRPCKLQDQIRAYVTTEPLVIYFLCPTDRKMDWDRFLCRNMHLMTMVKNHERASSEHAGI